MKLPQRNSASAAHVCAADALFLCGSWASCLTYCDNIQMCTLLYKTQDSLIFQILPEIQRSNIFILKRFIHVMHAKIQIEFQEYLHGNFTGIVFNSSSPSIKQIFTARLRAEPWRLEKLRDFGETYSKFLQIKHTIHRVIQHMHSHPRDNTNNCNDGKSICLHVCAVKQLTARTSKIVFLQSISMPCYAKCCSEFWPVQWGCLV